MLHQADTGPERPHRSYIRPVFLPWTEPLALGCGSNSPLCQAQGSSSFSFSTDDDNDVEVEALEGDSELNLVTEVWVEPQYGRVGPGPESWKHLQDLTYSEIPRAVSDL